MSVRESAYTTPKGTSFAWTLGPRVWASSLKRSILILVSFMKIQLLCTRTRDAIVAMRRIDAPRLNGCQKDFRGVGLGRSLSVQQVTFGQVGWDDRGKPMQRSPYPLIPSLIWTIVDMNREYEKNLFRPGGKWDNGTKSQRQTITFWT